MVGWYVQESHDSQVSQVVQDFVHPLYYSLSPCSASLPAERQLEGLTPEQPRSPHALAELMASPQSAPRRSPQSNASHVSRGSRMDGDSLGFGSGYPDMSPEVWPGGTSFSAKTSFFSSWCPAKKRTG